MDNICHLRGGNVHCTMRTQSCLAPPVSSRAAGSHRGRPNRHPGVQRCAPGHRCPRTYPGPEGKPSITPETLLRRACTSNAAYLCFHKFIPVVVWEGAVEERTNVLNIKTGKTGIASFVNPHTACSEPVGPTGPWCHPLRAARWCTVHRIPAFWQVPSPFWRSPVES